LQVCAALPAHRVVLGVHAGADAHEQEPHAQVAVHACIP
jgi:hypothetical protein